MANENWETLASQFWQPLVDTRFSASYPHLDAGSRMRALDSELGVLQTMMARARKLRNMQTGICRLPAEVILAVFLLLRDDWPPAHSHDTEAAGVSYTSGWMSVTHICSQLREVALGSPSLWAKQHHILDTPVLYIPTIISRAKNFPQDLRVHLSDNSEQREEHAARILSWFCRPICLRCEHLRLNGIPDGLLQRIFTQIAPHPMNLRSLHLTTVSIDAMSLELPKQFADMFQIEDLDLSGFHFQWDSLIFSSSLVHLQLDLPGEYSEATRPTYAQFKLLFGRLHSLRTLILSDIFPTDYSDETIDMPRTLTYFQFDSYYSNEDALDLRTLMHIRLPDNCTRSASIKHDFEGVSEPNIDTVDLIHRCASTILSFGSGSCAPQELVYAHNDILLSVAEHEVEIWWDGLPEIKPEPFDSLPSGHQYAHLYMLDADFAPNLESLNLVELRTIKFGLRSCETWTTEQWSRIASNAPGVRRAEISFQKGTSLLHALTDVTGGDFVLFRSLEVLVFHGPYGDISDEGKHLATLAALTHLVHLRKSHGSPLQEVVIMCDTEGWGTWSALKDYVTVTFI